MTILIDGYNLLKQVFSGKEITQEERHQFLKKALTYSATKGHTIVLVYDGGSDPRPVKEKNGLVTTVYSGYKQSADDVIKQYIDEKAFKNVLLVSSDKQLNSYADLHGIVSINSRDFYPLMNQKEVLVERFKKASGKAIKLRADEPETELDRLMEQGTKVLEYKEEQEEVNPRAHGSSKKEKRLLTLIKKL